MKRDVNVSVDIQEVWKPLIDNLDKLIDLELIGLQIAVNKECDRRAREC